MRVVGGRLKGRRLFTPRSDATRPTSDRTREALFNILMHVYPASLVGARVLDLFAGTGALGLEALSRGASCAHFVEEQAAARAVIRTNIKALDVVGQARIYRRDATRLGSIGTLKPFDLIFLDPPYGRGLGDKALRSAVEGGWLSGGALVVWEEAGSAPVAPPHALGLIDERSFGDTVLRFLRHEDA